MAKIESSRPLLDGLSDLDNKVTESKPRKADKVIECQECKTLARVVKELQAENTRLHEALRTALVNPVSTAMVTRNQFVTTPVTSVTNSVTNSVTTSKVKRDRAEYMRKRRAKVKCKK